MKTNLWGAALIAALALGTAFTSGAAFAREKQRSATVSKSITKNPDGSTTRSGSYTNASGGSGTFSQTRARNEDGSRSREGELTTADGESHDRSVTTTYDRDAHTLGRSVTGPRGHTRSGEVTVTRN